MGELSGCLSSRNHESLLLISIVLWCLCSSLPISRRDVYVIICIFRFVLSLVPFSSSLLSSLLSTVCVSLPCLIFASWALSAWPGPRSILIFVCGLSGLNRQPLTAVVVAAAENIRCDYATGGVRFALHSVFLLSFIGLSATKLAPMTGVSEKEQKVGSSRSQVSV